MQHRYFKWFYAHGFMLMFCSCAFVCFRLKTVLLFATFRSFVCSCFVDFSFHLKQHTLCRSMDLFESTPFSLPRSSV